MRGARMPRDVEDRVRANGHASRTTFTAAELLAKEIPPARWAVPGILPEGVALLAGKPKLGKSWLALDLCIATATGGYALGKKRVEQGEALYLALEDNERRLQKRLTKRLHGLDGPKLLHYATAWPRLNEGGAEALRAWLEDHPDARLIVIDTLAKVRMPAKGQNVYAEDYAALEKLLPLAAEFGVAVLVVHHLRKMSAADPMDEISGSTGLSGGVDGFLILKRDRGRHDAALHVDGRDVEEPAELALKWDGLLASWTLIGDAEEFRLTKERAEIVEALRAATPRPMSPKEVAAAVGKSANTVSQALYQMLQAGQVISPGRGLYTVPTYSPKDPKDAKENKDPKDAKDARSLGDAPAPKDAPKEEPRIDKGNAADFRDFRVFSGGGENGATPREAPEKLAPLVRAVFEEGRNGASKNLPHYLAGTTTLAILTNSVLVALKGPGFEPDGDERRDWEGVVGMVAEERRSGVAREEQGSWR